MVVALWRWVMDGGTRRIVFMRCSGPPSTVAAGVRSGLASPRFPEDRIRVVRERLCPAAFSADLVERLGWLTEANFSMRSLSADDPCRVHHGDVHRLRLGDGIGALVRRRDLPSAFVFVALSDHCPRIRRSKTPRGARRGDVASLALMAR